MAKTSGHRRPWRVGALKSCKSQRKVPCQRRIWRVGALARPKSQLQPMTQSGCVELQDLIDNLGDKEIDDIIQYVQQYFPVCIVGDDGNDVEVDLGKLTLREQHQLAKYVESIVHLDR